MFVNPITNQQEYLELKYPNVDYLKFKSTNEYNNGDTDLISILDEILKRLDCTIEYNCGRNMMVAYHIYSITLSEYYFYLSRITNQFIYNEYIDKVIKRHIDNLIFEYENPYVVHTNKKKSTTKKKKSSSNKFIKYITHDLFTNEEKYIYYNKVTGEEIESTNPNMLDELNAPKKKERKKSINIKQVGVPMSAMTFSFKKKDK